MNKIYAALAIIFSVFLGETTHCTRRSLPENANIDRNNADDMALVSIFGDKDKAALWKELGVLFRQGKVKFYTSTDLEKYRRVNSDLMKYSEEEFSEENMGTAEELEDLRNAKNGDIVSAEALMYHLFPRADGRSMSLDEMDAHIG